MPDVSVIIVNWNTKDLLLACIRSILTNTNEVELEIIVVDNASSDGSQEALRQTFPDVKLIQNTDNLGFAKANNIGIRASTGAYICLVNSDVEVKSGCIDRMIEYMSDHADIGIMGPKINYPDGRLQPSCKRLPSLWRYMCEALGLNSIFKKSEFFSNHDMAYFSHDTTCYVDCLIGAFWLVRRSSLNMVGLLDENFFFYSEDTDWCKRFRDHNFKAVFFADAEIVHYHGGSSSRNVSKYYIQLRRANLQFWKKHHGSLSLACLKCIMILQQIRRIGLYLFLYMVKQAKRENSMQELKISIRCLQWLVTTRI
jgi:GT2 family glycosyltransferase